MSLSEERLEAMKPSAPLLVFEVRTLRRQKAALRKLIDTIRDGCMCDPSVAIQISRTLRAIDGK